MAAFTFHRAFCEQLVGLLVVEPGHHRDDAARAIARFFGARVEVDHQVAVGLANPHHRRGRQHVEDELRGGSGLQARRAGDHFRADGRRDREIDERLQLGSRIAGDEDDFRRSPCARASVRLCTYGVMPLADTPMTTSFFVGFSR